VDYHPKADKMAEALEQKANELAAGGRKVVSFSITNSAKAGCHHFWRYGQRGFNQLGTASAP